MYEVHVYDLKKYREFYRVFDSEKEMKKYIKKIQYSKKLKLLSTYDWSYFYCR